MNNIIYDVCKRTLLRGDAPEDMGMRLVVFFKNNLITAEQYNELFQLMEVV